MKQKHRTIASVKAEQKRKTEARFRKAFSQNESDKNKLRPLSLKMSH